MQVSTRLIEKICKIWVLNYQVWFLKTKQLKKLLKILKQKIEVLVKSWGKVLWVRKWKQKKRKYIAHRKKLDIYKQIIDGLEGAKQFVSTPKKTGKGIDVIYYPNVEEPCIKLQK